MNEKQSRDPHIEAIESSISREQHTLNENFVVKVMSKVHERPTFFRRLSMLIHPRHGFAAAVSAIAIVVCVTVVYEKQGAPLPSEVEQSSTPSAPAGGGGQELQPLGSEQRLNSQSKRDDTAAKDLLTALQPQRLEPVRIAEEGSKGKASGVAAVEADDQALRQAVADKKDAGKPAMLEPLQPSSVVSQPVEPDRYNDSREIDLTGRVLAYIEAMTGVDTNPIAGAPAEKKALVTLGAPPPIPSGEQYRQYGENPRIAVATQPVSTFSIDVDTGAYTNVRRFLTNGALPPRDAVRIEEFINYFSYSYPKQYERPFSMSAEIAPSPLDSERYLLKLGVRARDVERSEKGWNLVFLVDVSGSMDEPNKLPLVKQMLKLLVHEMRPTDRVAIVTYAGEAGVLLDSTSVNERERILQAIESLGAGGSTNGSGGIMAAYRVAETQRVPGGVSRVILATDGDFNVGISSFDELMRLIEEKRRSGITLTTLGFGTGNYQEANMEQLANRGNGNYFYIDSFREARHVIEEGLAGAMEVVAKDVKLQIEFNPAQVIEYRLIGYDNRKLANEDFQNDAVDAGEIGSGHTVTALYEIVLKGTPLANRLDQGRRYLPAPTALPEPAQRASELAFLKVRYKEPEGSVSKLLEFPIAASLVQSDAQRASHDFRFAAAVSYFGALLRHSTYVGNYSLKDVLELARAAKGEDANGSRQEFIELVKSAAAVGR